MNYVDPSREGIEEATKLTADFVGNVFDQDQLTLVARLVDDRNRWKQLARIACTELDLSNRREYVIAADCIAQARRP